MSDAKTNLKTNLVGRKARIRDKWKPLPPKSPLGKHQDEWGEIVIVRQDSEGLQATVRWDDGNMFEFVDVTDWLEVGDGFEARVSRGVGNMISLTSMVENGNTLVLDAVIAGLERRNVPGGLIERLKEQRQKIHEENKLGGMVDINMAEQGIEDVAIRTRTGLVVRVCEWSDQDGSHIEIHALEDFEGPSGPDSPGFYEHVRPGDRFVDGKLVKKE